MLDFVDSDDELAFVLAHEVAHVNERHHVQLLEQHFLFAIVITVLFGGDATALQIANFVGFLLSRGFTRGSEFEADRVGVALAHRAGVRADAGLRFLKRLRAAEGRDPSQFEVFFRTHPGLADRITRVEEELRRLGYQVRRHSETPIGRPPGKDPGRSDSPSWGACSSEGLRPRSAASRQHLQPVVVQDQSLDVEIERPPGEIEDGIEPVQLPPHQLQGHIAALHLRLDDGDGDPLPAFDNQRSPHLHRGDSVPPFEHRLKLKLSGL